MFQIRLKGSGVSPKTVPLVDLFELVMAVQRAVQPLVPREIDDNKIDRNFYLSDVVNKSAGYGLEASSPEMRNAYASLQYSMKEDDYAGLPEQTIRQLHKINHFVQAKGYPVLEFRTDYSDASATVEITKDNLLKLPIATTVISTTTIYGRLIKIGGTPPVAQLKLPNDQVVNCDLNEELAKKIASSIYQDIGLEGEAHWKHPGWHLERFSAKKPTLYDPNYTVQKMFTDLKNAIKGDYDDLDDVEGFLKDLRGE